MKKFLMMLFAALLCANLTLMAQPKPAMKPPKTSKHEMKPDSSKLPEKKGNWKSAPIPGWLIHYDEAIRAAKKTNKKILIVTGGSDWDSATVSLRKSVFDTRDFQQLAKRSLILLYLDTPQKTPQPPDQVHHHDMIREKVRLKDKKMPSAVIIDANGTVLAEINGVLPKNDYLDKIRMVVGDEKPHNK